MKNDNEKLGVMRVSEDYECNPELEHTQGHCSTIASS